MTALEIFLYVMGCMLDLLTRLKENSARVKAGNHDLVWLWPCLIWPAPIVIVVIMVIVHNVTELIQSD